MSKDQSLQLQLKDAVARGDTQAIAALMRQGGIGGLLQTLRAVQAVASDQAVMASAASVIKTSAIKASAIEVPAVVTNALQQGNLIEAIKRLRQANPGLSLKAAKDHVETLGNKMPVKQVQRAASTFASTSVRTPTVVMGDAPGAHRWLLVLVAFAAVTWWWFTL